MAASRLASPKRNAVNDGIDLRSNLGTHPTLNLLPVPHRLSRGAIAAVFALLAATASSSIAQVGSTTDILTGTVTNTAGAPIPGATVEAKSVETQVTRRARTNADGRYTILFPDG